MLRLMPIEGYFQNYEKMTQAQIDAGLQVLGMNDPFPIQLLNFYKNTLSGDFGVSHQYRTGVAVNEIIADKLPISLGIGLAAMLLSLLVGLPLGIIIARSARSKYRINDWLGTAFVVLIQAVPSAIYYLMIQVYGTEWTGLPLLFDGTNPASWVLPILSLSLGNIAYYAMWLRRFMADEMGQNYVHLARAKGLSLSRVYKKHVFRNAIVPLVQFIPTSLLIGFSVALAEVTIGVLIGILWGYVRRLDFLFSELYNIFDNIPQTLVIVMIAYIMRPGVETMIFAMCLTSWLSTARLVRNQVLILRNRDYNLASHCLGSSTWRIIRKNLFPYLVSILTLRITLAIPAAIGSEVFITYIGLGVPLETPSLGNLIESGRRLMMEPALSYQLFFLAAILAIMTIGFYIVGSAFADVK